MEFSVAVRGISGDVVQRVEFQGDVEGFLEVPLKLLGVSMTTGQSMKIALSRERDPQYKDKYSIYMNGLVYYIDQNETRISIGGLIMSISRRLPFSVGDKVYVGIRLA